MITSAKNVKETMKKLLLLVLLGMATVLGADEKADVERIRKAMSALTDGQSPDSVRPSALPGLYEVGLGSQFLYVSADGRYVMNGDMIDLQKQVNLTETRRGQMRASAMGAFASEAIVYAPKQKAKRFVTVFTDVDCGYCRKLHAGMKEMNDLGIEVRYLAFPRAGVGSASHEKAVSIWCAKDRKKAMDLAKSGTDPTPATCENTVAKQLAFGQSLGVQGTPAIVLDDGRMVPGYVPPQRLAQMLEGK